MAGNLACRAYRKSPRSANITLVKLLLEFCWTGPAYKVG